MTWEVDKEFEQEQVVARTLQQHSSRRLMARVLVLCFSISIIAWYVFRLLVPQPSLQVSASEAVLRIPVANRAVWEWNEAATQPALEYGWNITIPNPTQRYMLGYLLFNDGKQAAQSGSLAQLLQAGQPTLQREFEYNLFVSEKVPVVSLLEHNVLVLRVQDAATIERVFASKPTTATLEITTPYESPVVSDISITYKQ